MHRFWDYCYPRYPFRCCSGRRMLSDCAVPATAKGFWATPSRADPRQHAYAGLSGPSALASRHRERRKPSEHRSALGRDATRNLLETAVNDRRGPCPHVANDRLRHMRTGSARVSKADGSQSLDLQRDALQAAGVDAVNVSPTGTNPSRLRSMGFSRTSSASRPATAGEAPHQHYFVSVGTGGGGGTRIPLFS